MCIERERQIDWTVGSQENNQYLNQWENTPFHLTVSGQLINLLTGIYCQGEGKHSNHGSTEIIEEKTGLKKIFCSRLYLNFCNQVLLIPYVFAQTLYFIYQEADTQQF